MDKRKNNGGARDGAGRKAKSYEREIRSAIDEALADSNKTIKDVWVSTVKEAEKGSITHQNTLYGYYYGKPKEHIDVTSDGEQLSAPQIILSASKPE